MRIFVTGATGYVGGAVVEALVRAGHRVTGLSRTPERDAAVRRLGAEPARGGLGGLAALLPLLAEHDALVHAAVDYGLGPPADREAIDALLAAARAGKGPRAVVYTSGVWVLGETPAPAGEGAPVDRPAAAVAWRPGHERAVLEAGGDRIAAAVIRPGIVFGEKRGLVSPWFAGALAEGAASFVGTGAQRWAFVHRSDLAELYRLVLERRARGIFHGVDGASPPVREAAEAASRAAGKGATRAIPVEEARKTMGAMADALAMDQVVAAPRGAEVGWAPRHPPFVNDAPGAFREFRAA
ncbi:MAG TPA: NAD-dependent epimerase/dehydratase family protein [Anaeromyxobacteraceae bacterium]|nr:NAD-dependent epimerase/dehydratase family protein [Anaeromyxobacteraceae bacterium]